MTRLAVHPACSPAPALAIARGHRPWPSPGPAGCLGGNPCQTGEPVSGRAALREESGDLVADRFWRVQKEEKPGVSFGMQAQTLSGWEMGRFCLPCGHTRRGESALHLRRREQASLQSYLAYFGTSSFSGRRQAPVQKPAMQKAV